MRCRGGGTWWEAVGYGGMWVGGSGTWWDVVGGRKMGDVAMRSVNKQCLFSVPKLPRPGVYEGYISYTYQSLCGLVVYCALFC
jgi:hypothetical protein